MNIKLRSYQLEAVKYIARATRENWPGVVLDIDAGLGKTAIALSVSTLLLNKGANILYLTKLTLSPQVIDEAQDFFNINALAPEGKTVKAKIEMLANWPKNNRDLVVVSQTWFRTKELYKDKKILQQISENFNLLIIDECHDYKNPNAHQSKIIYEISKGIPFCILMSGTLLGNNQSDIFMPYKITNPNIFGTSHSAFMDTYFRKIRFGNKALIELRPYLKEEFYNKVNMIKFTRKRTIGDGIPPLIHNVIKVEPSPEEKKILKEQEENLVTFLNREEKITASTLMENSIRLRQLCSAILPIRKDGEIFEKFNPEHSKVRRLLDLLSDILGVSSGWIPEESPKVIIWVQYRMTLFGLLDSVSSQFANPIATFVGNQGNDREKQKTLFTKNKDCHILIGTTGAGGVGLNLQVASSMIFFAKGWSNLEDEQAQARCWRIGSDIHEAIVRYDLIMKGSIEERIEKAINKKRNIVEELKEWSIHARTY